MPVPHLVKRKTRQELTRDVDNLITRVERLEKEIFNKIEEEPFRYPRPSSTYKSIPKRIENIEQKLDAILEYLNLSLIKNDAPFKIISIKSVQKEETKPEGRARVPRTEPQ